MILHFLVDSVYSDKFIHFVNENFNINNKHKFIIITSSEIKYITQNKNVIKVKVVSVLQSIKFIRRILKDENPNKIFLHFLSDVNLFPILFAKNNCKKYWVVWGGDVYSYINWKLYDNETVPNIPYLEIKKNIKQKVLEILRNIAIKKLDYIAINETEFNIIKRFYKTKAQRVNFKYPNPMNELDLDNPVKNKSDAKIILLGNSGDPSNNHLSIIKSLKNLNCKYKVLVPLSYGNNKEYIEAVRKTGSELLGEHFAPLMDFMNAEDYAKLLLTVDVAIMNHYRQQGVGNLRILLTYGKKVYLNENNPLYHYFTDEGIKLSRLEDCKFDESIFEEYSDEIKEKNKKAIQKLYSNDKVYAYMKDLFI